MGNMNRVRKAITNVPLQSAIKFSGNNSGIVVIGATVKLSCKFCSTLFQTIEPSADKALFNLVTLVNNHVKEVHPDRMQNIQKQVMQAMGLIGTLASLGHLASFTNALIDESKSKQVNQFTELEKAMIDQLEEEIANMMNFVEEFYLNNRIPEMDTDLQEEEKGNSKGKSKSSTKEKDEKDEKELETLKLISDIPPTYKDEYTGEVIESSPRMPLLDSMGPEQIYPTMTPKSSETINSTKSNKMFESEQNVDTIVKVIF